MQACRNPLLPELKPSSQKAATSKASPPAKMRSMPRRTAALSSFPGPGKPSDAGSSPSTPATSAGTKANCTFLWRWPTTHRIRSAIPPAEKARFWCLTRTSTPCAELMWTAGSTASPAWTMCSTWAWAPRSSRHAFRTGSTSSDGLTPRLWKRLRPGPNWTMVTTRATAPRTSVRTGKASISLSTPWKARPRSRSWTRT